MSQCIECKLINEYVDTDPYVCYNCKHNGIEQPVPKQEGLLAIVLDHEYKEVYGTYASKENKKIVWKVAHMNLVHNDETYYTIDYDYVG